ncbi:MAG TPA: hypothetical protein VHX12_03050, partial [Acidisoma sp.]|nr:hypothetical protein [Acidisoma sp.]
NFRDVEQPLSERGLARRFSSAHSVIYGNLRLRRHLLLASTYRKMPSLAFEVWKERTYARSTA